MILDEFLIKFGIQADTKTLEEFSQGLEKIGVSAAEFVEQASESFSQFADELDLVAQSAEKGQEQLTANLAPEAFNTIFGHLGENAKAVSEQIDNTINDIIRLGEQAAQGNPEALTAYIEKAEEFANLTDGLGEAWTAEFGEISQIVAEVSEHFQKAYDEALTLAQGAENLSDSLDDLGKSSTAVTQVSETQGKSVSETTSKLDKQKNVTQKLTETNKQFTKGTEEATKKLSGFIVATLGLDKAKGAFEKLKNSIDSVPKSLGALTGVLGAAVGGLTLFVSKAVDALDGLHQLSQVTGESTEYMYRLGKVAETIGSSAQAAQSSIQGLSKTIGEAASGVGRGAKTFEQYGLSARNAKGEIKQTSEMLEEIRHKMIGLSQQEKIAMLSKLGIDGSMIQVLMKSSEDFKAEMERAKKMTLGVGTKEQAQAAADFKDSLANLQKMMKAVAEVVALRLAPAITRLISVFETWFVANSDLILKGLELLGDSIAFVIGFIAGLIEWIDFVISSTIGWEKALYIVGGAMVWFNRKAIAGLIAALWRLAKAWLATPVGWITTALIAIGLLIEDIIVWLQGGESAWGKYYEKIRDTLKGIKAWFISTWESIKQKFKENLDDITGIFSQAWAMIEQRWNDFISDFNVEPIGTIFALVFDFITLPFKLAFEFVLSLWNAFTGSELDVGIIERGFAAVKEWITQPFKAAFDTVVKLFDTLIKPIIEAVSNLSFDGIKNKWEETKQSIGNAWEKTKDKISGFVDTGLQAVGFRENFAKAGAVNTSNISHNSTSTVANSNNRTTVNIAMNGTGNSRNDAIAIANMVGRTVNNTTSPQLM